MEDFERWWSAELGLHSTGIGKETAKIVWEAAIASTKKPKVIEKIDLWLTYSKEYETVHGTKPCRNAKSNAILKKIKDSVGIEMADNLIKHYLSSDNKFYFGRCHPLDICLKDINILVKEMATGVRVDNEKLTFKQIGVRENLRMKNPYAPK
jgi:hypothetical protein